MEKFDYEQYKKDIAEDAIAPEGFPDGTPRGGSSSGRPIHAYHNMRYELPEEITEWIGKQAKEKGVSDSKYLTMILTDLMNKELKPRNRDLIFTSKKGNKVFISNGPTEKRRKKKTDEKFIDLDSTEDTAGTW